MNRCLKAIYPARKSSFHQLYLKASAEFGNIIVLAENCLRDLQFEFYKNGTQVLAEFEVTHPNYFRAVIEPNKIPKTWNFLMPSITAPKGSTIDIRFGVDSSPEETIEASKRARDFLRALAKALPEEPWKGLPSREYAREKKRWQELIL